MGAPALALVPTVVMAHDDATARLEAELPALRDLRDRVIAYAPAANDGFAEGIVEIGRQSLEAIRGDGGLETTG